MEIRLKDNERIDDLERNGYRIIQNKGRFCFGMDAVLLSGFVCDGISSLQEGFRLADLGTGTGILPILLHAKLGVGSNTPALVGLEIQEEMAEMARRSVRLNDLERDIRIVTGDLKEASKLLGKGRFDVVVSNPPYKKQGGGIANPDLSKAISRHEILCDFEDVARESAALLKPGGQLFLVHRPERLAELMDTLRAYKLEPKRMRLIHPYADAEASLVLLEAARGGKPFLKVERPLILYREKGVASEEIRQIYSF